MKVLLLGATGRTGKLILEQLLECGHTVNAIVRDKTKIKFPSPALAVFEGSTLDAELLSLSMAGCDAIISALNISRTSDFPWSPLRTSKTLMSDTIKKVIAVADNQNIKRIIVLSAWGVAESNQYIPWWFKLLIAHSNINYAYIDHQRQEALLAKSNLHWTIIRPAGLVNFGADKPITISLNNNPKPSLMISRKSVAKFVIRVLEGAEFIHLMPVISWK